MSTSRRIKERKADAVTSFTTQQVNTLLTHRRGGSFTERSIPFVAQFRSIAAVRSLSVALQ